MFPFSRVVVRLGELDLDSDVNDGATPVDVPVEKSIPHSRYNPQLMVNDIALLKLKYTVTFNSECLICVYVCLLWKAFTRRSKISREKLCLNENPVEEKT